MLTHFKPTGTGKWDIRVVGKKKGRVMQSRGSRAAAILTRPTPNAAKDAIRFFMETLNGDSGWALLAD
jgi:hypothetical protein